MPGRRNSVVVALGTGTRIVWGVVQAAVATSRSHRHSVVAVAPVTVDRRRVVPVDARRSGPSPWAGGFCR